MKGGALTVCCLVKIPHPVGGTNEYLVDAASLFDAVRRALEINEGVVPRIAPLQKKLYSLSTS